MQSTFEYLASHAAQGSEGDKNVCWSKPSEELSTNEGIAISIRALPITCVLLTVEKLRCI